VEEFSKAKKTLSLMTKTHLNPTSDITSISRHKSGVGINTEITRDNPK